MKWKAVAIFGAIVVCLCAGQDALKELSSVLKKLRGLRKQYKAVEAERTSLLAKFQEILRKDPSQQRRPSRETLEIYNRLKEAEGKRQELERELESARSRAVGAVRAAVSADGEETLHKLLKIVYRGKPDIGVEAALLDALASSSSDEVVAHLIKFLEEESNAKILCGLCRVMEMRRERRAADALIALLQNRKWEVVVAAAKALAAIRVKKAVEPMIEALQRAEDANNEGATRGIKIALQDMTGKYSLTTAADFRNWWNATGKMTYDESTPPPPRSAGRKRKGMTSVLYGEITSKRVIFICDVSHSMSARGRVPEGSSEGNKSGGEQAPATGGGMKKVREQPRFGEGGVRPGYEGRRIDILKLELAFVINKLLPEDAKFNVITFSTDVQRWRKGLTKATPRNKKSALEFVKKMEPQAMTNLYGALELAFRDRQVDTIYLLSDGNPTVGTTTKLDEILAAVRRWNKGRNVVIHTIALLVGKYGSSNPNPRGGSAPVEDRQRLLKFLKQLAKENGGVCRVFMD